MASDEIATVDTELIDGEESTIELLLDVKNVENGIKVVSSDLLGLKKLINSIGTSITKAFKPATDSMNNMRVEMIALTDSISSVTEAIQKALAPATEEVSGTDWLHSTVSAMEGMVDTINAIDKEMGEVEKASTTIQKFIDVLKNSSDSLSAIFVALLPNLSGVLSTVGGAIVSVGNTIWGVLSTIGTAVGLSAGWIAVIIAAVAAAIAAVIIYWDEIKLFFTETLPQLWTQFTEWVSGIAASVAEVFSAVMASIVGFFTEAWNWLVTTFAGIGQWVQENVIQPIIDFFTPLAEWFAVLFGSIRQTISDVFYNIGVIVTGCWEILQAVWGVVAEWFNVNVIEPVAAFFSSLWDGVCTLAANAWEGIKGVFTTVAEWFGQYVVQPVADFFTGLWEGVKNAAAQAWEGIKSVFGNVAGFFKEVFSNAWAKVVAVFSIAGEIFTDIKDGILTAFKKIVNGIITGINSVVRIPFDGINSALGKLRGTSILGISPFSGLGYISVPQIPYLAQGAVLPANKPFMAVVGDQRHGTNVEAPLATIQEAVGLVMSEQLSAMVAGFQALLDEQRATRQAVESICIGDETIANAVDRHRHRKAMMCGF